MLLAAAAVSATMMGRGGVMRTPANAATASSCMADSTSAAEAKTRGIRLELEIRLLGHLLGKQPPLDLVSRRWISSRLWAWWWWCSWCVPPPQLRPVPWLWSCGGSPWLWKGQEEFEGPAAGAGR